MTHHSWTVVMQHRDLIERNAYSIWRKLPFHVDVDDLIQAGTIGAYQAVQGWDRSRGARFSTYATLRIRGAIYDELRASDPLSQNQREAVDRVQQCRCTLEQQHGRAVSTARIAATLGENGDSMSSLRVLAAIENTRGIDDAFAVIDDKACPLTELQRTESRAEVTRILDALPLSDRDRSIMHRIHINDEVRENVACDEGISPGRITQIDKAATAKARRLCAA